MTTAHNQATPQASDEVGRLIERGRDYARMFRNSGHGDAGVLLDAICDALARLSPPSSPVGDGEAPAEIWANPERGTCRAVGSGVWASDTLYVRADLSASRPPEPAASGPEADVRSVPDDDATVEHVARALCAASYVDPDELDIDSSSLPTPKRWEGAYAVLARAAIRALASSPAPESGREGKLRETLAAAYKVLDRYAFDTFDWQADEGRLARGVLPRLEEFLSADECRSAIAKPAPMERGDLQVGSRLVIRGTVVALAATHIDFAPDGTQQETWWVSNDAITAALTPEGK